MNAPTNLPAAQSQRAQIVVNDPIPVLDTARFDHMQRIATAMAASTLIPDSLCMVASEEDKKTKVLLPQAQVIGNCFLVVNQAVRWGMDPFAVAQCVSVVHGKICYEGKLIAAVLDAKLGIKLEYEITGQGEDMKVVVGAADHNGEPIVDSKGRPKIVIGTVSEWKTTGNGSPWSARGGYPRMLRYRGAREWARTHAPALMLGVYSPDEMEDLADEVRASRARDITQASEQGPKLSAVRAEAAKIEHKPQPPMEQVQTPQRDLELVAVGENENPAPSIAPTGDEFANWRKDAEGALSGCTDSTSLFEVRRTVILPAKDKVSAGDWQAVDNVYRQTFDRIALDA